MLQENEFYDLMDNFSENMSIEEIHKKWFDCFDYMLRSFNVGHNKETINSLFYNFDMDNWKIMHKENTEYRDYSKKQLLDCFCNEAQYISDRYSYDRIFRTHWLFKNFKKA